MVKIVLVVVELIDARFPVIIKAEESEGEQQNNKPYSGGWYGSGCLATVTAHKLRAKCKVANAKIAMEFQCDIPR